MHDWPEYGLTSDVRATLAEALRADSASVMVTLYAAEGATPLGLGAQMLFAGEARAGFLSGGCVEGDVALQAAAVLDDGVPRRLVYGRGGPPDIQLLCGSRIELLVERIDAGDPAARRLAALAAARRPALWLSDGRVQACLAEGESPSALPRVLREAFSAAVRLPALAGSARTAVFRRFDPAPRLAVVGADPIALAIAGLAVQTGMETWLLRPKGPAQPPPMAVAGYLRGPPADALAQIGLDAWTAVAVATHDLETDHAALLAALPSDAAYVGVLGSRKRIPERLGRLKAEGVDEAALMRLKAPMGLEIGARAPWEIGLAAVAEATAAFRAREARRTWPDAPGAAVRRAEG